MKEQQTFSGKFLTIPKMAFGGSSKSNPKTKRPLSSRLPIHLVLKTDKSVFRLANNFERFNQMVERICKKYGVKIYEFANVGNHCHLLIKLPHIYLWLAFISDLTSQIAIAFGIEWSGRPFTRIVQGWGKAFKIALEYVILNQMEGDGKIKRQKSYKRRRRSPAPG